MKKIIFCFISIFFLIRCSDKVYDYDLNWYKDCKSYKYIPFESDSIHLDGSSNSSNKKWDISIKKSNNLAEFFFKDKKRIELNTKNITLLFREFDNRFLLLYECQPNERVATNDHLKINKVWIFDTQDEQMYFSILNGKTLQSECHARTVKSESHHINSPYGLVSIEIDELKLVLLETTHKKIEFEIIESNAE